jgi:hypothetical protein
MAGMLKVMPLVAWQTLLMPLIAAAQAGIWFGFLYMAYIYGNLHNTNCFADSYSEFPLLDSDMLGINVTKRFSIAIRWGFWMSTLNVLRAILA